MKKFLIVFFSLLLLCSCSKKEEIIPEEENKNEVIESTIQYIIFRENKYNFHEDFQTFVMQFKDLGCNFISRDSNNTKLFNIDEIAVDANEFYSLSGGSSFLVTCPYEKTHTSVSFSGIFDKKDDSLYVNKKINEWHISTTNEEVELYVDENTSIFLGGKNNDTIKTLKEKLGAPTSENKSVRGYIDKIFYEKEHFNYDYQVLDPFKDNTNGKIYALYVTKKANLE